MYASTHVLRPVHCARAYISHGSIASSLLSDQPALLTHSADPFGLVLIAASAGGLEPVCEVVSALPASFPAPVVVLLHRGATMRDVLPAILRRWAQLPVYSAADLELLRPGTIITAPGGRHLLLVRDGRLALSDAPRIHFARPAADLLFTSAAAIYGRQTLAVVLSGNGRDGAAGTRAVKASGGAVVVQDQASAAFFGMPQAVIQAGAADLVLPSRAIGPAVTALVMMPGAGALFGLRAGGATAA